MINRKLTTGFGAPVEQGAHLFRVSIPLGRGEPVTIIEDYGFRGIEYGNKTMITRASISRKAWTGLADAARREFNRRLKAAKVVPGKWEIGGVSLVDRLLGKELCVLVWATERAQPGDIPTIVSKWASLRPEERWWLFAMTAAEAGREEDGDRGWRKALYNALSDGKPPTGVQTFLSSETGYLGLSPVGGEQ